MPNYFLDIFKYQFDKSGTNEANLIMNEPAERTVASQLPVVPKQKAFYTESMIVVDDNTGDTLMEGTDYTFEAFSNALTAATGKQVAHAIILTDETYTGTLLLTYQCVGGAQGQGNELITDLINAITSATENASIAWAEILNKPERFPASAHVHALGSITGLETLKQEFDDFVNALVNTKPLGQSGQDLQEQIDGLIRIQAQMQNAINRLGAFGATATSITAINEKFDILYTLVDASIETEISTLTTLLELPANAGTSIKGTVVITDGTDAFQAELYMSWTETTDPVANFMIGSATNDDYYPTLSAGLVDGVITLQIATPTASTVKVKWHQLM